MRKLHLLWLMNRTMSWIRRRRRRRLNPHQVVWPLHGKRHWWHGKRHLWLTGTRNRDPGWLLWGKLHGRDIRPGWRTHGLKKRPKQRLLWLRWLLRQLLPCRLPSVYLRRMLGQVLLEGFDVVEGLLAQKARNAEHEARRNIHLPVAGQQIRDQRHSGSLIWWPAFIRGRLRGCGQRRRDLRVHPARIQAVIHKLSMKITSRHCPPDVRSTLISQ